MSLNEILNIAKNNNGIITSAMVTKAGISRGSLHYLTNSGKLEKVSRGVYLLPEAFDDEMLNYQARFKKGIYSLDTALYLNGLSDRTPHKFNMTFPYSYNLSNPKKEGILCSSVEKNIYELGKIKIKTPMGNYVYCYNPERTLCDILKTKNKTDIQIITTAFKIYISTKNKNIPLLSEYAKKLKVEEKVRSYLEVLL